MSVAPEHPPGDEASVSHGSGSVATSAEGEALLQLALGATALFAVVQVAAVAVPSGVVLASAVIVSLVLFGLGCVAFLWGFLAGVGRSREEAVTLAGLLLLQGTAEARPRRILLGALAVQVVVALASAIARPFTPVAFGILVPMLGTGLLATWGGRYGRFGAAPVPSEQADPELSDVAREAADVRPERVRQRADPVEELDDFDRLFSRRRRRGRPEPE